MLSRQTIAASILVALSGTIGAAACAHAQSGVPSQPGTPSVQPAPRNPSPRAQPPVNPGSNDPNQPASNQPGYPTSPAVPPGAVPVGQPGTVPNGPNGAVGSGVANGANGTAGPGNSGRYGRPFAFQVPESESRFSDNTRRLVQMEQRMARNNETLLKRLGEVRGMTGERQTTAMYDLLQQLIRDNGELTQYLVQSRTAWSGDMEMGENSNNGDAAQQGTPLARPSSGRVDPQGNPMPNQVSPNQALPNQSQPNQLPPSRSTPSQSPPASTPGQTPPNQGTPR